MSRAMQSLALLSSFGASGLKQAFSNHNGVSSSRLLNHRQSQEDADNAATGSDLLDALAEALGQEEDVVRMALLERCAAVQGKSRDGQHMRFALSGSLSSEIENTEITATTASRVVMWHSSDYGWWVDSISIRVDGLTDDMVARLEVSGHEPTSEVFLIGQEGLELCWNRVSTSAHTFTFTCPVATDTNPARVLFAAKGERTSKHKLAAMAGGIGALKGTGAVAKLSGRFGAGAFELAERLGVGGGRGRTTGTVGRFSKGRG